MPGESTGSFGMSLAEEAALVLGDVTGDGRLDVIVGDNAGGAALEGALNVYAGDPEWSGLVAPSARLLGTPGARLGWSYGSDVLLADLDGDDVLDLVAPSFMARDGDATEVGAVFTWNGGPSLTGTPAGTRWVHPLPKQGDRVTLGAEHGLVLGEVTGDGRLDLLTASGSVDVEGVIDAGAIHLGVGGGSTALTPLTLPVPGKDDRLGE